MTRNMNQGDHQGKITGEKSPGGEEFTCFEFGCGIYVVHRDGFPLQTSFHLGPAPKQNAFGDTDPEDCDTWDEI